MYVLIDTNIWGFAITDPGQGRLLEKLEKLIDDKVIHLLVPEALLAECHRKFPEFKKNRVNELEKSLRKTQEDARNWMIDAEKRIMDDREDRINKIIALVEPLPKSLEVYAFCTERNLIRPMVPPFSKDGRAGIPDAVIFYTTTFWLTQNGLNDFTFLSNNFNDFGDPLDRTKLHAGLNCTLDVDYHASLYTFLLSIGEIEEEITTQTNAANNYIVEACKEKSDIFDHLFDVTKAIYSQVGFVPLEILSRVAPFRINDPQNSHTHFHGWVLYTNNQRVVDFFAMLDEGSEEIRFKHDATYPNTPENLEKLKFIAECLNQNMVYHIGMASNGGYIRFDSTIGREPNKQTVGWQYSKMYWKAAANISHPEITKDNAISILSDAGVLHDMGMEAESSKLYLELYRLGKKAKLPLLSFNVLFALRWRGKSLLDTIENDNEKILLEKELLDIEYIDQQSAFYSFQKSTPFEQEMASAYFLLYAINQMTTGILAEADSFDRLYEGQLRGNYASMHNSIAQLFQKYMEYQFFLIENGIPLRGFTHYSQVAERYISCLFKAAGMNHYQADRLNALNENMLLTLIYIRKPEKLTESFYLYLKKPFALNARQANRITVIIQNFLEGHEQNIEWLDINNNSSYWYARKNAYYEHFWNFLVLLAIVDFDEVFIRSCGHGIISFLTSLDLVNNTDCRHIAIFIQNRGKMMGNGFLKKLMQLCIEKKEFHVQQVFNSFTLIDGLQTPPALITTHAIFKKLVATFDITKQYHQDILLFSHNVSSPAYKRKLSAIVNKHLATNLDWHLYFAAAFRDVIDPNSLFHIYLPFFSQIPDKNDISPQLVRQETKLEYVNQLMVLSFKYGIKIPSAIAEPIKKFSNYYEWLLDMENFNYKKFDPLWILQFNSTTYYKKMFSIIKVKMAVKKFIEKNEQPRLTKLYALHE